MVCVWNNLYSRAEVRTLSTINSRVPGWIPQKPGRKRPSRAKFPLRTNVLMSEDMMAFVDIQATNASEQTGKKISRQEMIREMIAIVAWEKFDQDIE